MKKLREVFGQHTLVIASTVIALALLVIFVLQYRSLRTQEATLSLYRREAMSQYTIAVVTQLRETYLAAAKRALEVPGNALTNHQHGIIADDPTHKPALTAVSGLATHFQPQEFNGARRFFIAVATEQLGLPSGEVFFYNAQLNVMERDLQAPEMRAINVACAPFLVYIRSRASISNMPSGVDRDPEHRLIVKPVVDTEGRIIAVVGMVLTQKWFCTELAPRVMRELLPQYFPTEQAEALVSLTLEGSSSEPERVVFSTQPDVVSPAALCQPCVQ